MMADFEDLSSDEIDLDGGDSEVGGNNDEVNSRENLETQAQVKLASDVEEQEDDCDIDGRDLEAIKARVREMEEEHEKLKQMKDEVDKQMNSSGTLSDSDDTDTTFIVNFEEKAEIDARSIYVGNVDYGSTAEELENHFQSCGFINRVTILCNRLNGHPKGFAYIEFADKPSVSSAVELHGSLFRGRALKVVPKRTNRPGMSSASRGFPRGRGSYYYGYKARGRSGSRSAFYAPY